MIYTCHKSLVGHIALHGVGNCAVCTTAHSVPSNSLVYAALWRRHKFGLKASRLCTNSESVSESKFWADEHSENLERKTGAKTLLTEKRPEIIFRPL